MTELPCKADSINISEGDNVHGYILHGRMSACVHGMKTLRDTRLCHCVYAALVYVIVSGHHEQYHSHSHNH